MWRRQIKFHRSRKRRIRKPILRVDKKRLRIRISLNLVQLTKPLFMRLEEMRCRPRVTSTYIPIFILEYPCRWVDGRADKRTAVRVVKDLELFRGEETVEDDVDVGRNDSETLKFDEDF